MRVSYRYSKIVNAASYFPERVMTNHDLEKIVDTSDEWIQERTGIAERRIAAEGETTSDLSLKAVSALLEKVGCKPTDIDLLIVATITPDYPLPSTACVLQDKLGATNAWCFDLNAACSGFVYALTVADQFMTTGKYKNAVVVGAEVMSSILNFEDRTTCVLFGDGAGAVFIESQEEQSAPHKNPSNRLGIIDSLVRSDGSGCSSLIVPAGGCQNPPSHETIDSKKHYVHQDGPHVFKVATTRMAGVSAEILERNQLASDEIKFFVPHQANSRIIEHCAKKMRLKPEQVFMNIQKYGNTTAATIPTCLAELSETKQLSPGDLILMASFGAGFTYGSILARWQ